MDFPQRRVQTFVPNGKPSINKVIKQTTTFYE